MVNLTTALTSKHDSIRVFDLAVLRLSEMDMQTGTVYKTYADINCEQINQLFYVVESSCGRTLRISECGKAQLTMAGQTVSAEVIACNEFQAAPFVVVAGLETSTEHPSIRLTENENNILGAYKKALSADVVHSQTFAKGILDFFSGMTQAVVCPIAELAKIDILLIEALKSRYHVTYRGVDTPVVMLHNGIMAAKAICS